MTATVAWGWAWASSGSAVDPRPPPTDVADGARLTPTTRTPIDVPGDDAGQYEGLRSTSGGSMTEHGGVHCLWRGRQSAERTGGAGCSRPCNVSFQRTCPPFSCAESAQSVRRARCRRARCYETVTQCVAPLTGAPLTTYVASMTNKRKRPALVSPLVFADYPLPWTCRALIDCEVPGCIDYRHPRGLARVATLCALQASDATLPHAKREAVAICVCEPCYEMYRETGTVAAYRRCHPRA